MSLAAEVRTNESCRDSQKLCIVSCHMYICVCGRFPSWHPCLQIGWKVCGTWKPGTVFMSSCDSVWWARLSMWKVFFHIGSFFFLELRQWLRGWPAVVSLMMLVDIVLFLVFSIPGIVVVSLLTLWCQNKFSMRWIREPERNPVSIHERAVIDKSVQHLPCCCSVVDKGVQHLPCSCSQTRVARTDTCSVYVCMKGSRVHRRQNCSGMMNPLVLQLCKKCFPGWEDQRRDNQRYTMKPREKSALVFEL